MNASFGSLAFVPLLITAVLGFLVGIAIIVGALKMRNLQSHGWATTASVLAMLPCGPVWLLGLPMGIWSLVVLNRRNVKTAFRGQLAGSVAGQHSREAGVPHAAGPPTAASNRGPTPILIVFVLVFLCVPALFVVVLALGVSVFWGVPIQDHKAQSMVMESAVPIATPGRIVMPARDHDEARTAGSDFVLLLIDEQLDKAFNKLSATHEPRDEALAAWKQSIQSKPEYIRLRELVKEGMGNSESGQFDDQGRYLYRWICGVAKNPANGRGEIEVHATLAKEGLEWKVEDVQFERP